jgi:hypothetical protein
MYASSLGGRAQRWSTALALGLLLAVPLFLFRAALFQGQFIAGWDTLALGLPFHAEVQRSLAAHQWPLWLPGVFGGMPGIASSNLYFAYPTAMLGALLGLGLPATLAWDTALHVALAGAGMFLFLRRLDRSVAAALLGAVFFQASGSLISQLNGGYQNFVEGIALVPWAFWAACKARDEGSTTAWAFCGLALGLQVEAAAAQLFVYTLFALALFALARPAKPGPGGRLSPLPTGLAVALGTAFFVSAPQLWPTLQYLPFTERQGYSHAAFVDGSIGLREALTWLVPGFFGWKEPSYDGPMGDCFTSEYLGLLPWALATAALAALWARERMVRWMASLGLAALFLAQRDWTPFYGLFQHLPILKGFRIWSRILFLAAFAACSLAAYGWDALRDPALRKRAWSGALAFTGLALAAAALAYAWAGHRPLADAAALHGLGDGTEPHQMTALISAMARGSALLTLGGLLLLLPVLWAATRPRMAGLALVLALAFHAQDQWQVLGRFIPWANPDAALERLRTVGPAPDPGALEPFRVADAMPWKNRLVGLGYEQLAGTESMRLESSVRISRAMQARLPVWMDLLNVRYVMVPASAGSQDLRFLLNPGACPRAWLLGRARAVADDEAAYRLLADPAFDPRREALLAQDPGLPGGEPRGSVAWLERSPETASLEVATDRDAVLLLSNAWYPGWRCRVDGVDGPVLEADGGLQAVALKAGRHRLELRFDPWLFNAALAASAAALALLLGLGLARPGLLRFF